MSGGAGIVAALVLALGAVVFCFWPISGRSAEEWLPIVGRHGSRRARGQHVLDSPAPQAGAQPADGRPAGAGRALPEAARDLELLAAPLQGEQVGVMKDRRARTYTAVLAVKVTSFGLLDRAEQESRQAGWGGVLAGLAREGSPVSRIQWIERTVPADGDEIGRYLGEAWDTRHGAGRLASDAVLSRADEHRSRRSRRITSCSSACRSTRSWPGGRSSAQAASRDRTRARAVCCCANSRRSPSASPRRTSRSSARFAPECSPPHSALRSTPGHGPASHGSRPPTPTATGSTRERPGRSRAETSWSSYRTDGAFHATYWIAGWPRIDVGAAFLSPLLLHAQMVRAIAVTIEPISPLKAIREVEAARTSDLADRDLRGRMGFIETARGRRRTDAVARREEELADGHAAVRFAGYVTVSARTLEELERHCSEIEHAAQMARLELLRLYGQQDESFTYTLPLCRGLR